MKRKCIDLRTLLKAKQRDNQRRAKSVVKLKPWKNRNAMTRQGFAGMTFQ